MNGHTGITGIIILTDSCVMKSGSGSEVFSENSIIELDRPLKMKMNFIGHKTTFKSALTIFCGHGLIWRSQLQPRCLAPRYWFGLNAGSAYILVDVVHLIRLAQLKDTASELYSADLLYCSTTKLADWTIWCGGQGIRTLWAVRKLRYWLEKCLPPRLWD